ncbi:hypothetical protein AAFF_G00415410 [Aldrovandia affinis]|uniref:Uncharacterized protein n=1 Tax=Aldrovandia affinis TaxID=143900 RepID=A0AAD7WJF7_9TELE|nr:hypothetical protein AAFF_G00415410 [Aldrovandia affinis]
MWSAVANAFPLISLTTRGGDAQQIGTSLAPLVYSPDTKEPLPYAREGNGYPAGAFERRSGSRERTSPLHVPGALSLVHRERDSEISVRGDLGRPVSGKNPQSQRFQHSTALQVEKALDSPLEALWRSAVFARFLCQVDVCLRFAPEERAASAPRRSGERLWLAERNRMLHSCLEPMRIRRCMIR